MRITVPAIAISAVVLLALAGCAGGGEGSIVPDGTEPTGPTERLDGGEDGTGCPYGAWALDTDDLAAQLEAYLDESSGQDSTVAMDGTQRLLWGADGAAEFSTDLTVTVTMQLDDGLEMTITQLHAGGSSGELAYADGTATPSGWDQTGYTVTSTIDIDGVPTEAEVPIGEFFEASTPMQIGCEGEVLTTSTEPSFVTQRWVREG